MRVESLLEGIRRERETLAEERVQAERARRALEDRQRELQVQLRNIDQLKREALAEGPRPGRDRAGRRARPGAARAHGHRVGHPHPPVGGRAARRLEEAQRELRQRNRQRRNAASAPAPPGIPTEAPLERRALRPGDRVRVPAFDSDGDVLTAPELVLEWSRCSWARSRCACAPTTWSAFAARRPRATVGR